MSADALQPVRDAYDAFNRGDIDEVLLHFDPDIEIVDSSRRVGTFRGHDAYREFVAEWLENWDEYRTEIQGLTQNGDRVLVDVLATGRGKGSGIELSEPVTHVITLRDGKISRFEVYPDRADAMRSAGLGD